MYAVYPFFCPLVYVRLYHTKSTVKVGITYAFEDIWFKGSDTQEENTKARKPALIYL